MLLLQAAKWRKVMADFSVQQVRWGPAWGSDPGVPLHADGLWQATQHLQAQRRACVAQREVQAMRDEKKDSKFQIY